LSLQEGLKKYFLSISTNGIEWVISPLGASAEHNINIASDLTYAGKEQLISFFRSNSKIKISGHLS
jgi:hypothetical protein